MFHSLSFVFSQKIYISTLDRKLLLSKADSLICERFNTENTKFNDSIKKNAPNSSILNCYQDSSSEFPGGVNKFRNLIANQLIFNSKTKKRREQSKFYY